MNIFKKIYCRCFQTVFHIALPVLPYRNPVVRRHISDIPYILKQNKILHPVIITDKQLTKLGATAPLLNVLDENRIEYALFSDAFPNPTLSLLKTATDYYRKNNCDGIIAFGGGSPMDLAKAVGVSIARPKTPLIKLRGILKVHAKLPTIIAIPTTAGTGSETTLAAVLVDEKTNTKFSINDFPLIPSYAILDSQTVHTLPPYIAAATGIDALTHAVESYIGGSTIRQTRKDALKAIRLIYENIDGIVNHTDKKSEKAMLLASHLAGRSFTRSYVGYVHAISHSLSGRYNLPHGETNAILLPLILRRYGDSISKKLAEIAVYIGLGTIDEDKKILAERFIKSIENMNRKYNIPSKITCIRPEDIPALAGHADKEANPLYPVPVLWNAKELEKIYEEVRA